MTLLLGILVSLVGGAEAAVRPLAPTRVPLAASAASVDPLWRSRLEQACVTTAAAARQILAARGEVKVLAELAHSDTRTITEYSGAPFRVEPLDDPQRVFRHWVRTREALEAILRESVLRAGPVPYVEFTGGSMAYIKAIYVDIHGAFFTVPGRSASEPRVMNQEVFHFVDFRLPGGLQALRLDGDDVLVIPAPVDTILPISIVSSSR